MTLVKTIDSLRRYGNIFRCFRTSQIWSTIIVVDQFNKRIPRFFICRPLNLMFPISKLDNLQSWNAFFTPMILPFLGNLLALYVVRWILELAIVTQQISLKHPCKAYRQLSNHSTVNSFQVRSPHYYVHSAWSPCEEE